MVTEEVAYGDFNIATVVTGVSLMSAIITRNGSKDLAQEWVPRMVGGEVVVGVAVTEPSVGSDAANLSLRARRDGDHYVLNGEKTSITFANSADAFLVFARTGTPEEGAGGVSALLVPRVLRGIEHTIFDDVGSLSLGRGSLFFEDARVPVANLLGSEGKGLTQVLQGFDYSRALIGLQCVGAARASLDEAWAYTRERKAFGGPIAQYQGVTFPLVECDTQLVAVRQLCYHALALRDANLPHTAEAAMVKWLGPKTAFDTVHQCLLTLGHYGYSKDTAHQQRLRDVMGLEIGDGTAAIMKLIIARERVGRVAVQYSKR
jgi:cyclohexanecarboxyl-CoA dehydrogenase